MGAFLAWVWCYKKGQWYKSILFGYNTHNVAAAVEVDQSCFSISTAATSKSRTSRMREKSFHILINISFFSIFKNVHKKSRCKSCTRLSALLHLLRFDYISWCYFLFFLFYLHMILIWVYNDDHEHWALNEMR